LQVHKVSVPLRRHLFHLRIAPQRHHRRRRLCVKSGNAIILRGGKEALASNTILHAILQDSLKAVELPPDAVQLVTTPEREVVGHLLRLPQYIDLVIPRGGESLIRRVAEEATMPVLKHYMGNCHVYVDRAANLMMAPANHHQREMPAARRLQRRGEPARTCRRRSGVSAKAAAALTALGVELRGCPATCAIASQGFHRP